MVQIVLNEVNKGDAAMLSHVKPTQLHVFWTPAFSASRAHKVHSC